jgi:hypothetical protein
MVADSDHFDEVSVRIRIKVKGWICIRMRIEVKSWISIRIKVLRIFNPSLE